MPVTIPTRYQYGNPHLPTIIVIDHMQSKSLGDLAQSQTYALADHGNRRATDAQSDVEAKIHKESKKLEFKHRAAQEALDRRAKKKATDWASALAGPSEQCDPGEPATAPASYEYHGDSSSSSGRLRPPDERVWFAPSPGPERLAEHLEGLGRHGVWGTSASGGGTRVTSSSQLEREVLEMMGWDVSIRRVGGILLVILVGIIGVEDHLVEVKQMGDVA
ncbi:hypothetical protein M406DRAFT_331786 [Cryphonectria parasitica EP155]|uniref:Uncharacterized protein n=1 Tax=Cryphonectria parasitica (strain ATCC 38755 / EP155) TaxID=660469 RepID=A0A9P5CMU6_CRYP1|nr:uncharacterized protein M406DRAFT_331786 [Cryphonectria parasitica EP155]KAF3763250.1 hypothetical protein M406DRAFT_331786 [Cryphonectria parasitica EP155]